MPNPDPEAPPHWPQPYYANIMLFYPRREMEEDHLRQACDDKLQKLQRLRPEGAAIANMQGFGSGGMEAPVPLMVAVSSSNDISFELAFEESIRAIIDSGMQWALTVNLGGEEITEASGEALSLIQEMMNDNRISRAPVRHRDSVATEAASSDSETRWGHDGSWWDRDG